EPTPSPISDLRANENVSSALVIHLVGLPTDITLDVRKESFAVKRHFKEKN
ncbi:DNA ligase, partial [Dissostichus eleginoides]